MRAMGGLIRSRLGLVEAAWGLMGGGDRGNVVEGLLEAMWR